MDHTITRETKITLCLDRDEYNNPQLIAEDLDGNVVTIVWICSDGEVIMGDDLDVVGLYF